ncbi:MAG TPA: tetratricopeptide repeat protein [Pirellulales bacterium]|jgi:tetratricopeptide (TPR) repeat protein|nr:tetratricopeptide repeat protein [Pirellulales bacterium]
MLEVAPPDPPLSPLAHHRVALVGRFASMSRKQAQELVAARGAVCLDRPDPDTDWIVVGESDLPSEGLAPIRAQFDEPTRRAIDAGRLEILTETELWRRLGFVGGEPLVQELYTPAMLAELLGASISQVRQWQRRKLIAPVREVRRLPYFDFREVTTARRIQEWLAAGLTLHAIEKQGGALSRRVPEVARPLADLPLILDGKQLLFRQTEGLTELGGQLRFDFADLENGASSSAGEPSAGHRSEGHGPSHILSLARHASPPAKVSARELFQYAAELEEAGDLPLAAEMYRAALAAGGPSPEICFLLAELLYRLGDLAGARERYYVAVELDENYVEARANLGCVLAEQGERELAAAAFSGALAFHPEYADAHYHLARLLDDLHRHEEARAHWQAFLDLAPETPWAEEARARLLRS